MKLATLAVAAALATAGLSAPALAQTAGVTVGAKVYGPQGGEVGTIEKIQGEVAVVNTGNLTANLPVSSFGESEKGPTIGWNKAQLEAAVTAEKQKTAAAFAAALVPGNDLYSVDNVLLGKVKEVGADGMVVVDLATGSPVSLPKDQMAMQANKLTFLATAAAVQSAVAAQTGGVATDAASTASTDTAATTETETGG